MKEIENIDLQNQRHETTAPTVMPPLLPAILRFFREPLTQDEQKTVFSDWFHL